ncbi:hypothetical protein SAMN04489732_1317 [Amycolatopsis saalfeldensis]|uniref:Uncharacterized protein n=1 Tax=Amycolatopsis saalfeldensis TaxID=394193 RepID=A0A1H8YQY6_9PSEU|nr:hypothetical protein SAMN04489732_1317 [Amycolatopsis saalfeldensis]
MMTAHHTAQLLGDDLVARTAYGENMIAYHQMPDQGMVHLAPPRMSQQSRRRHQTGVPHPIRQDRHLYRERGTRLPDVMHPRQPHYQRPYTLDIARDFVNQSRGHLLGQPLVHQQTGHSTGIIQMLSQRQPVRRPPMRIQHGLRPHHTDIHHADEQPLP